MKKIIGLFAAVAMVAMMALPAAAADLGVFTGPATVGANATCNANGTGSVSGAGLGLLSAGNYGYTISAPGSVVSLARGGATGSLNLCGPLNPGAAGLGASCITTSSSGGQGEAVFSPTDVVTLSNVGWAATAGGSFVVTGNATGGTLAAAVQALDNGIVQDCLGGIATVFNVVAAYAIV